MNILDYLASEFSSFEEKPFNEVDSLILSHVCMVDFDGIAPALKERQSFTNIATIVNNLLATPAQSVHFRDALQAEHYDTMFTGLVPAKTKELLIALAASPRFRDMTVSNYLSLFDVEQQTQFAAMTFIQKRDFAYVGFRGTDSSFTGWKEDFNMAFSWPIPSQEQAQRYLEATAKYLPRKLILGGHSKGGNLAVFAAIKVAQRIQERIAHIYNHDGPGFKPTTISDADYANVHDRITKTVPVDSIVGMLMESREHYRVVVSTGKGIMQHDPFTWEIDGTDFVYAEDISDNAKFADQVLTEWLSHFSDEELSVIVDALFTAVAATGAEDATDIMSGGAKTIALLTEASRNTVEPERSILGNALVVLTEIVVRNVGQGLTNFILPKSK